MWEWKGSKLFLPGRTTPTNMQEGIFWGQHKGCPMQILLQKKVFSEVRHPRERIQAKGRKAYRCIYWVGRLFLFPADTCPASPPRICVPKDLMLRVTPLTNQQPEVACNLLFTDENEHHRLFRMSGESWDAEQTRAQHFFYIRTFFPWFSFPAFFFPFHALPANTHPKRTPAYFTFLFSTFKIMALNFLDFAPAAPTSHTRFPLPLNETQ